MPSDADQGEVGHARAVWRSGNSVPQCLLDVIARFSRASFQEPAGSSSRENRDGGALSNPASAPCQSLPTRLADGLGLESTPVREAEPAPLVAAN